MYFHCKSQASTLYANNLSKLLLSMAGTKDHYHLDMADDVVRGSIVLNKGALAWPPNPPISGTNLFGNVDFLSDLTINGENLIFDFLLNGTKFDGNLIFSTKSCPAGPVWWCRLTAR